MKIIYESENSIPFGELEVADWFEYNRKIFMKTLDVEERGFIESNAVATDGTFKCFCDTDIVLKLEAELLIRW